MGALFPIVWDQLPLASDFASIEANSFTGDLVFTFAFKSTDYQ